MIERIDLNSIKPTAGLDSLSKVGKQAPAESIKQFSSFLNDALNGVAAQEVNAQKVNERFLIGEVNVDQMMIASEQALLSLQLTTQVRNKVIEAYQEIMRTQI